MPVKSQYRLYYGDLRGLAEPIRMIFHYANEPFEDVRLAQDKFAEVKKSKNHYSFE